MLEIKVGEEEYFREEDNTFFRDGGTLLQLEHSLVSIASWESKWEKPFLGEGEKSDEETIDYIRHMTLTKDVDPDVYNNLLPQDINAVNEYIQAKQSATFFNETLSSGSGRGKKEIITAELVYHWIVALQIDWEVQYWHFNRLLTLVKVINAKNKPEEKKKGANSEFLAKRNALNAQRKAKLGSKG